MGADSRKTLAFWITEKIEVRVILSTLFFL